MYKSIDLNLVANHVKTIYDNVRCNICDKYNGRRVRYYCGHTSCEECQSGGEGCILCLTPPGANSAKPIIDKPLTRRTENAINLLHTFQDCFKLDVLKRQRQSEALKAEKELFPHCIQAPSKYYNKRKSSLNLSRNKENTLSPFPGQEISNTEHIKMENSNKNVEKWINKYIKRKPLSELNPNKQISQRSTQKRRADSPFIKLPKRRLQIENILSESNSNFVSTKHAKKRKFNENIQNVKLPESTDETKETECKNNVNNESGIVMDDDAVVVIDDSPTVHIDKDLTAWLAVQQAENNAAYCSKSVISSTFSEISHNNDTNILSTKIPFYKKAKLTELCKNCKEYEHNINSCTLKCNKDVSMTVDNKDFTAVIKVSHIDNYLKHSKKRSVEVQTDVTQIKSYYFDYNDKQNIKQSVKNNFNVEVSQDIFLEKNGKVNVGNEMKHNVIIIEESDSDEDQEASLSLEVTADVHRSCEQIDYKILTDVDDLEEHSKRARRAARGLTPTSTDSSDKENFDPNRMRKSNNDSKKKFKK